jgi:hypothetical protein
MKNITFWILYGAVFLVLFVASLLLVSAAMGPSWMSHYGGYVSGISALLAGVLSDFMAKAGMKRIKK